MIPSFVKVPGSQWPLLPPGIYEASLNDIQLRYAINPKRVQLFHGLKLGVDNLFKSGCPQIFLDGSYVTAKPFPGDYEVCWDARFVNPQILDPVFLDFSHGTAKQKQKYLGEYFPASTIEARSGKPFLEFFQTDKDTGVKKGIIKLNNYLKLKP